MVLRSGVPNKHLRVSGLYAHFRAVPGVLMCPLLALPKTCSEASAQHSAILTALHTEEEPPALAA